MTLALNLRKDLDVQTFRLKIANGSGGLPIGQIATIFIAILRETPPKCGNRVLDGAESCDPPGFTCAVSSNPGFCNQACSCELFPGPRPTSVIPPSVCPNGIREPGEQCDGQQASACGGQTCRNDCTCNAAPAPTISSVSPNPVTGSNIAQPFTINGTNFVTGANVTLRDLTGGQTFLNRQASSFSSTQIVINPNFTTDADSWSVEVINPDGKSSGQFNFSVVASSAPAPTISGVSPNPVTGANIAQPFTINGTNFVTGANVTLRDLTGGRTFANPLKTTNLKLDRKSLISSRVKVSSLNDPRTRGGDTINRSPTCCGYLSQVDAPIGENRGSASLRPCP